MTTPSTSGEQPTADQTPEAGVTPQAGEVTKAIEGLSTEQQLAMLDGVSEPAPEPAAEAEAPESATTQTEEPAPVEGEKPQTEEAQESNPETAPEAEPKAKPAKRIRLTGLPEEEQQRIIEATNLVRDKKAASFEEAMKTLAGDTAAPAESNFEPEPEPEPAEKSATLDELNERLANLRLERKEAKADYDNEKDAELTDEIEDVLLEIQTATLAERESQIEKTSYNDQFGKAVDEVETKYAEAFDKNDDFEELLDAYKIAAETNGDPMLRDPRYIVKLADKAARVLGISSEPVASMAPKAPKKTAKPVGSSTAPGNTHRAVPTKDQVLGGIDSMSVEQLSALVDSHG